MTKRLKFKFHLHRIVIVLFCLALLVALMQGVSYFSLNNQTAQAKQSQELARTLAKQVTFTLAPLLDGPVDSIDDQKIKRILQHLTEHSRILDVSVYQVDGTLIAQQGDGTSVRDRLALDGQRPGSYFNQQIVEMINSKEGPLGFIRLTLDTHVLATESQQVDNTTNMLRLMLLLAMVIGIILGRTLLMQQRSGWKKSPYLLTAGDSEPEETALPASDTEKPIQRVHKKKRPHKKRPYR
ncbi:YtjB family periplasmic protein [Limnobaculum parvum]|uniref:YtjB family periplasmic protein n=1 Tax=Limnobaculum parvum TaxID=2172103 RepID=A0A2Y9TXA5_9GAMM|nr:YtjB family periplasmic protein [Limnobaculum parvum]AWH88170.1 YtjB family periplasmic protein [Limnobaculum parvum]